MAQAAAKKERPTKIDHHGLGPMVLECLAEGMTTEVIAAKLSAQGVPIDQSTVSRWIRKERERNREKSERIFSEHVEKELPKDLDALEEMERICLDWAREEASGKVERLLTWRRVEDALDSLTTQIMAAAVAVEDAQRRLMLKGVVRTLLGWVIADFNDQKQRLAAMKMAGAIIEVKLRHVGALGENEKGKIVFNFTGEKPSDAAAGGGRHLFTVKTSKE